MQTVNARVSKIVENQSVTTGGTLSRSRKPYLTPGQRFQIGKEPRSMASQLLLGILKGNIVIFI